VQGSNDNSGNKIVAASTITTQIMAKPSLTTIIDASCLDGLLVHLPHEMENFRYKNSKDERGDETFEREDVVKALALCFETIV
jgi:hypothetical protein